MVTQMPDSPEKNAVAAWTEIGPNPIPNGQVQSGSQLAVSGRTIAIAVHPTDPNIVYAGTAQGGLYRTIDGGATWTLNSNRLYAGTDIGVYTSPDGGASWTPFGTGLPRVAVFDMALTSGRLVRIATHGRGMWEIAAAPLAPTAASVSVGGRVLTDRGKGLINATVVLTDINGFSRAARTSSLGYYRFDDVAVGETYILSVKSKRYGFAPQVVGVTDELSGLNFVAVEQPANQNR